MSNQLDIPMSLDDVLRLDRSSLSLQWRSEFVSTPNSTMRTEFLRQAVGWQVQARLYGGLDTFSRKTLKYSVSDKVLRTGTKLIREWQGTRHQVTVLEKGFEYDGNDYRSLSAIARQITGTAWNGLVFFGLKK